MIRFCNIENATRAEELMDLLLDYDEIYKDINNIRRIIKKFPNHKELALRILKEQVIHFECFSINIREDIDIVELVIDNPEFDLKNISSRFKKDVNRMLTVAHKYNISNLTKEMRANKDVIIAALQGTHQKISDLERIDPILFRDKEVALEMASSNWHTIYLLNSKWTKDPLVVEICHDIVMCAVGNSALAIYAAPSFKYDREIAIVAVSSHTNSLEYFPHFKDDDEIVKIAVKKNGCNIKYASDRLKNDETMVRLSIDYVGKINLAEYKIHNLVLAGFEIRKNIPFMWEILNRYPILIQYAGDSIRNNVAFMRALIFTNPSCIHYAGAEVLEDVDVVRNVVFNDMIYIEFLNARDRIDPKILYFVLRKTPRALFIIIPKALRPRGYSVASVLVCLRLMCGF